MARIESSDAFAGVNTVDLGQGDRINLGVAGIMFRLPEVAAAVGGATAAVRETGALSPRLMELVRLRIAFHNQCRSCMSVRYQSAIDDGLTEDAVCSLERPAEAPDLTDAERSALRFADLFATNHLAIDDAVYDDLRQHFSEDQLVALGPSLRTVCRVGSAGRDMACRRRPAGGVPSGQRHTARPVAREFRCRFRLVVNAIRPARRNERGGSIELSAERQAPSRRSRWTHRYWSTCRHTGRCTLRSRGRWSPVAATACR